MKHSNKYIGMILLALNSSGSFAGEKYPIGNRELTAQVKQLEHDRKIAFDVYRSRWVKTR